MKKGDRVKPSALALSKGLFKRQPRRLGTVIRIALHADVLWDGTKYPDRVATVFLEVVDETPQKGEIHGY